MSWETNGTQVFTELMQLLPMYCDKGGCILGTDCIDQSLENLSSETPNLNRWLI